MRNFIIFISFLFLFALTLPAQAEPVRTKHVTAELLLENQALQAGAGTAPGENYVGLRLEMIPDWHTYWQFPGDSGLPTEVVWHLPPGWSAGPMIWELPNRLFVPPLVNYGYEGETLAATQIHVPATVPEGETEISGSVSWLVCKEECVPEKAELRLKVRVTKSKPSPATFSALFQRLREQQSRPLPQGSSIKIVYNKNLIGIEFSGLPKLNDLKADFFPLVPMPIRGDSAPRLEERNEKLIAWFERSASFNENANQLSGVFVYGGGNERQIYKISAPVAPGILKPASSKLLSPPNAASSWMLVLFAFLGGLILNLMPCVFPVLGIKVLSLVRQHGSDRLHAKIHGKVYALGVVVCFWILSAALLVMRSLGAAVGWGFQLQQPLFVTALILLFSLVAADLGGFIEWSGRWMGAGAQLANREGYLGSFFTGVLAVVVATPCTAPFMGTAIGAAISEPAWVVLLVFTALGLGLAIPFLVLCYQPSLLGLLPKPGVWMVRLKEFFAFPMAATVLWLLWVLAQQIGADGALKVEFGLLVILGSFWFWRRVERGGARIISYLLLLLGIFICFTSARSQPADKVDVEGKWKPYSEAALTEALDSGRPVFVDFTAAWCLTCQVNKKLVLDRNSVQDFFREKGVTLLLADWTNRDPEITRALELQGRLGVPLYLAYPKGVREAKVLPQVLSEEDIRSAFL